MRVPLKTTTKVTLLTLMTSLGTVDSSHSHIVETLLVGGNYAVSLESCHYIRILSISKKVGK